MDNDVILVVGGAGYIGSHACKTLARQGCHPVVYDNLCSGRAEAVQWGSFAYGDIRDRERLSEIMEIYRPRAVMHFAALIEVAGSVSDPAAFYDNNVYGTLCLLEEMRAHGIRDIVFSSTAAVYGIPKTAKIREDHDLCPVNPYGQTKLAAENMIRDFSNAYNFNYAILRYFNAAGADPDAETGTAYRKDTHLVPLLMRVADGLKDEIEIFGTDYEAGDGTAVRDYIHVTDLAEAHALALSRIMTERANLTLNLGTGRGYSVLEVVEAARRITRRNIPARIRGRRTGDPPALVADASKAREILDWNPARSDLDSIISSAWAWRRRQTDYNKIIESVWPEQEANKLNKQAA